MKSSDNNAKRCAINIINRIIEVDDRVDEAELELLDNYICQLNLKEKDVIMAKTMDRKEAERILKSMTRKQKVWLLNAIMGVAAVDNDVSEDEVTYICAFCETAGIDISEAIR